MRARLFPLGDSSPLDRELVRMGVQPADSAVPAPSLVGKLLGAPAPLAALFLRWLQQAGEDTWGIQTPGAEPRTADVLFGGSPRLVPRLRQEVSQTPALHPVLDAIAQAQHLQEQAPRQLLLGARALPWPRQTYIMGILNVTPDSFSDGGLYLQPEQALKHAEAMLAAGADVIDVGGQSSRPGAAPVPSEVEYMRVVPVVQEIVKRHGALVSVDTYRSEVAEAALDVGAVLINDISALRFDARMAPLLAQRQAAVVLMHMQGTPQTMQHAPTYRHVLDDVYNFLADRLHYAMQCGLDRQRILLDPGFGFGKTVQHNLDLLRELRHLRGLGQPLLVGTSRKSFVGELVRRQVWDRLEGTLATVLYAALHGATFVRVHDVASTAQTLRLLSALERPDSLGT